MADLCRCPSVLHHRASCELVHGDRARPASRGPLTILCDVDSIIADLLAPWLAAYNDKHGRSVRVADVTKWKIHECVPDGERIYELLHTEGLYRTLLPLPGALEGLRLLHDAGHHVVLLTACANKNENAAGDKLAWIRKHLPWLSYRDVIIGFHKHLVRGDVLIDDSPENIREYRAAWPSASILTIDYAYNRGPEIDALIDCRAESYQDTAKAWAQIVEHVSALATEAA